MGSRTKMFNINQNFGRAIAYLRMYPEIKFKTNSERYCEKWCNMHLDSLFIIDKDQYLNSLGYTNALNETVIVRFLTQLRS